MNKVMTIEPLKDDTSAWREKGFWRDLFGFFFPDLVLVRRLKQQLKDRPNVWGIGLWQDERLETAAKKIAQIFEEQYAMPTCFIPDDPFFLIAGYRDDLDPLDARLAIEEEFQCTIPNAVFDKEPDMTYRRFVEIVLSYQGNDPR